MFFKLPMVSAATELVSNDRFHWDRSKEARRISPPLKLLLKSPKLRGSTAPKSAHLHRGREQGEPTCKHTHVENALDGREGSHGEGFNESSRCADEVQLVFAPLPTILSHLLRLWQLRWWWTHCSLTFFHQHIVRLRDQILVVALLIT